MLRDMFKKTYTRLDTRFASEQKAMEPNVPEGMWRKCNKCGQPIYTEDVIHNYYICPKCKGYFRVHAYRRIEMVADEGSFEEWDREMPFKNPLDFPGYEKKVEAAREKSHLNEAVVTGKVSIGGTPAVIGVCDARFLMSSMGNVVGEKITRAVERATEMRFPVILFACSGGARMQEGIVSLMQMAKTSAALKRHSDSGNLYVSVLTDPTTGGVTASFAMLGDIILAEPGALIGFAGPRVIEQTIGQKLPEGFQRAEFLLEHGFVDRIVAREEMREVLAQILKVHERGRTRTEIGTDAMLAAGADAKAAAMAGRTADTGAAAMAGHTANTGAAAAGHTADTGAAAVAGHRADAKDTKDTRKSTSRTAEPGQERRKESSLTAWEHVKLSRMSGRPTAMDYIEALFSQFMEFHGDRYFGDDGAVVGGVAWFHGRPVTVIGQQKGRNTKDNIKRNFGMPNPEGYRKALRLMKQAEKFGRPIICFVDTPGAFCGLEAEERGQGEAIARNLFEMSSLTVPVLSIVIGEGGSGGALALATANQVWMMENAIYSVLSPEGFASILWKDSKRADEAARVMKITAKDLLRLGVIERIISEETPADKENLEGIARQMEQGLEEFLDQFGNMSEEELREQRYSRFRGM